MEKTLKTTPWQDFKKTTKPSCKTVGKNAIFVIGYTAAFTLIMSGFALAVRTLFAMI